MRIANVMRRIAFDEWGGTETAVWNSSLKLKEAGHSVEILATKALCGLGQEEREGLPVRRFDYFYPQLFLNRQNKLALDKKGGSPFSFPLYSYLKKTPFDLIHSHAMGRVAKMALKTARQKGIPFVISFHGGNYDVPQAEMEEMLKPLKGSLGYGRFIECLLALPGDIVEESDGIICVGKNEFDLVREKFPGKLSIYLPNGVDYRKFERRVSESFRETYSIPPERKLLLCVSRIDYQKNQCAIVKLAKELAAEGENVHCAIIGFITSSSYYEKLCREIEEAGMKDRVTIVPGLPPGSDLLLSAYRESDLFILPSVHEPFGIVVLEAWSAKLPTIVSQVGGLRTLVEPGRNGFHFDPQDVGSMKAAYHAVMSSREQIIENAYREVLDRYSWDTVTASLLRFYEEVRNHR